MPSHSLPLAVRARQRVAWAVGRLPRWARGTTLTALVGVAVVGLALLGGVVSGKLEHTPAARVTSPVATEAATIASTSTTSTTSAHEGVLKRVKADLVEDMTLDVASQRLDADLRRRLALAETPDAIARRHADIALAWAPDKVASTQARYDQSVRAAATNPASPSVTDASFVVTQWVDVTTTGAAAHASCRGHYRLVEPGNPKATAGAVETPDRSWTVSLTESGGRWRLEERTAA